MTGGNSWDGRWGDRRLALGDVVMGGRDVAESDDFTGELRHGAVMGVGATLPSWSPSG